MIDLVRGSLIGFAEVVPGVSGGTMALILGIYERLLRAIRSFDKDWLSLIVKGRFGAALSRNDLPFLAALGAGILAALLFFTHVVPLPKLIVSHPEQVYGLFFGLILASVFILMGAVERYGPREIAMTLLGVAAGFTIVNLVPVETPDSAWFIFLCGFVAISAMLLPGISGSFILLILGKYAYIIDALGHFDLAVIAVFVAGMASVGRACSRSTDTGAGVCCSAAAVFSMSAASVARTACRTSLALRAAASDSSAAIWVSLSSTSRCMRSSSASMRARAASISGKSRRSGR